ncbi:MAG: matrixin family metalloprotease [Pseudomonadales bacterium]|nr:matrixin family metalloprotease [Pseudomonadales bacterium]
MNIRTARHAICLLVLMTCATIAKPQPLPAEPFVALDTSGPITYFIDTGTPESAYREGDRELARWALDNWERAAKGVLRFEPAPEKDALVRIYFASASSGQYGETMAFTMNGRRGAAVFVRPDTRAFGPPLADAAARDRLLRDTIVYLTCLHELGHALGLSHTERYADIMYSFGYGGDIPAYFDRYRRRLATRNDITGVSGLSNDDSARLLALYDIP